MSITNWAEKINSWWGTMAIAILALIFGVALGRLWGMYSDRPPVTISQAVFATSAVASVATVSSGDQAKVTVSTNATDNAISQVSAGKASGQYVASKNSAKYHLPWCPGALRIKEENKRWFNSKAEAEAAGLTPAANCPGI